MTTVVATEDMARAILQSKRLFFGLLDCMNKSAIKAVAAPTVKAAANSVNILPIGIPNLTRRVVPLGIHAKPDTHPIVQFEPRSLTLVGGAAVQVYEHFAMKSLFSKQTTDIDAVWWPQIHLPATLRQQLLESAELVDPDSAAYAFLRDAEDPLRYTYSYGRGASRTMINSSSKETLINVDGLAVLSSSFAIQTLIQEYSSSLKFEFQYWLDANQEELESICKGYKLSVRVDYKNLFVAGICNIWGYLVLTPKKEKASSPLEIKLIELSIHDGASSQKSNMIEQAITDVVFSQYDLGNYTYVPKVYREKKVEVRVPIVERLLDQQLLALQFRIEEPKPVVEKIYTNIFRCKYLYTLLLREMKVSYIKQYVDAFQVICKKREYALLCESIVPSHTLVPVSISPLPTQPQGPPMSYAAPSPYAPSAYPMSYGLPSISSYTPSPMPYGQSTLMYAPPMASQMVPPMSVPMTTSIPYMPHPSSRQTIIQGMTPDQRFYLVDEVNTSTGRLVGRRFEPIPRGGVRKITRRRKLHSRKKRSNDGTK